MPTAREVLNELKWREGLDLESAEVWYVHRGAPNDTAIIPGRAITELGHSFFQTADASIPYHRVLKIVHAGQVLFDRREYRKDGF